MLERGKIGRKIKGCENEQRLKAYMDEGVSGKYLVPIDIRE